MNDDYGYQDDDQGDNDAICIPVAVLPQIVHGAICSAPDEQLARQLAGEIMRALLDAKEHWTPTPAPELEALWDAPAYGENS